MDVWTKSGEIRIIGDLIGLHDQDECNWLITCGTGWKLRPLQNYKFFCNRMLSVFDAVYSREICCVSRELARLRLDVRLTKGLNIVDLAAFLFAHFETSASGGQGYLGIKQL